MTSLHRRARSVLGLPLALFLMGTGWSPEPPASTFQVFGPQTFRRAPGRPVPVVVRFAVADPLAPYTRDDGTTSAVIRLNGTTV